MFIRSTPSPTPIASSKPVKREEPLAPRTEPPKPEQEPLVIELTGSNMELLPGELAKIVDKMNEAVRIFEHTLRFEVADDRVIVRVINTETGTVVREIPPERLFEAFTSMEHFLGVLLDWRV